VAVDAFGIIADHFVSVGEVFMDFVCALLLASPAGDAPVIISCNFVVGIEKVDHCF